MHAKALSLPCSSPRFVAFYDTRLVRSTGPYLFDTLLHCCEQVIFVLAIQFTEGLVQEVGLHGPLLIPALDVLLGLRLFLGMAREQGTSLINFPPEFFRPARGMGSGKVNLLILRHDAGKGSGSSILILAGSVGKSKFLTHFQ